MSIQPSSSNSLNEAKVRALLQSLCNEAGGIHNWARPKGYTSAYIKGVLNGELPVSDKLAGSIGLKRIANGAYVWLDAENEAV